MTRLIVLFVTLACAFPVQTQTRRGGVETRAVRFGKLWDGWLS